jgi:hypothetical protein
VKAHLDLALISLVDGGGGLHDEVLFELCDRVECLLGGGVIGIADAQ